MGPNLPWHVRTGELLIRDRYGAVVGIMLTATDADRVVTGVNGDGYVFPRP